MDLPTELRDFLVSRRARLTPEAAGIQPFAGKRRVPGLRREETAFLAGVSVEYYTKFERGKVKGASEEVVDAIARALQLNEIEHEHLRNLAQGTRRRTRQSHAPSARRVPAGVQSVLDALTVPAFVQNERLDILAANALGRALYPVEGGNKSNLFNSSRFLFLDPRSHDFFRDRGLVVRNNVALLHAAAVKNPNDESLIELIGELSTKSAEFRQAWADQDVLRYRVGPKRYLHPLVGEVDFTYETFTMPAYPGLTMLVYNVEPQSATAEALRLLGSWTAPNPDRQEAEPDTADDYADTDHDEAVERRKRP
ncbi:MULTISPECIES: helix-turn-helix domain-containing protein [unclassified Nocardiopsis]|uniref:helix-turn-helix domain-containing protein n=1 Tax=unclassified Nocardiopsis TaxID=2649073 RepID=UPI00066E7F28|nr:MULTISPECIES: helix-turn-helix transcriptional regulator [unclassified Nocardiopsis]MBQ1080753.1 helix-turn-helix domain-containing protein [Nocardiopsis sp. B62]